METEIVYFARVLNRQTGRLLEAVVWNGEKNRVYAEFDRQGLFETSDPDTIDALTARGYRKVTLKQIRERGKMPPSEYTDQEKARASMGYRTVQDPSLLEDLRKEEAARRTNPDDFSEEDYADIPESPNNRSQRDRRSLVK